MHHRVGALRRFDGVLHAHAAAVVLRVGQNHQRLAPGFLRQLVRRRPDTPRRRTPCRADCRPVAPGALAPAMRARRMARSRITWSSVKPDQQIGVTVEADHHGQIAFAQHAIQEANRRVLLGAQRARLAAAGIDQQAQGDGQIGLARKREIFCSALSSLTLKSLCSSPVDDFLGLLVSHRREQADQVHLDANGLLPRRGRPPRRAQKAPPAPAPAPPATPRSSSAPKLKIRFIASPCELLVSHLRVQLLRCNQARAEMREPPAGSLYREAPAETCPAKILEDAHVVCHPERMRDLLSGARREPSRANFSPQSAALLTPSRAQNFRLTSRRPDRIKEQRTSRGRVVRECVVGENASVRHA